MTEQKTATKNKIPALIHVINVLGMIIFWVVIYLCSIDRIIRDSIIIISAAIASGYVYYRLRQNVNFNITIFGLTIAFFMFIILAENIIQMKRFYDLNLIRNLELSPRLLEYVSNQLQPDSFENVGNDPLFYRRVPGSAHKATYDDNPKNGVFAYVVDETGYVNLNRGYYNKVDQIDLFISGDSVLQGAGMPSIIEGIKARVPYSIWNLSTSSYSPRQKVEALIRYGLPKRPKWLIVEFFSGNDASEANEDEICEASGNFRSRFAIDWMRRRFESSPKYQDILQRKESSITNSIITLRTDDFTLALTSFMIRKVKNKLQRIKQSVSNIEPNNNKVKKDSLDHDLEPVVALPADAHFEIQADKYQKWVEYGLENTIKNFKRLANEVKLAPNPPKIIILYNPSSYEIYQGILVKPNREYDQRAKMQVEALTKFAKDNNMLFINLLPGIREKVKENKMWMYGARDSIHWSQTGSRLVEEVLFQEMAKNISLN
jgi:hypothetical protein